jgi:integrase
MGGRWTTRRRSQTRIEENHTDRPHEKVGYLATDSSGRNRRARYSTRGCADLKALLRDLQNEAPVPPGTTAIQKRASGKWMEGCSGRIVGHKEALCLRWDAIDFMNNVITVLESKTPSGRRKIPLSARCKTELLSWRKQLGADYSAFVFPNFRDPSRPAKDIRKTWEKALKDAGIEYFWLYNLRHSHASRLSAAGVPDLFVAQMIGHSSPGILQRYSKAIDEYRRDAIRKLEQMRERYMQQGTTDSNPD